jgi:hypothetical protein
MVFFSRIESNGNTLRRHREPGFGGNLGSTRQGNIQQQKNRENPFCHVAIFFEDLKIKGLPDKPGNPLIIFFVN